MSMFGEDDLSSINILTAFIFIKYFSSLHLAIGYSVIQEKLKRLGQLHFA